MSTASKSTAPSPPTQFYVVYILHSPHTGAHYVGSTPAPIRRLNQHNGLLVGGAKKTARSTQRRQQDDETHIISCRPWEMAMFAYGFMDAKSALRFEWALQHPYESKDFTHIWDSPQINWPNGKRRHKGSTKSLEECILMMNLLLTSNRWSRYPLRLNIFTDSSQKTMHVVKNCLDKEFLQKPRRSVWYKMVNWERVVMSFGQFAELKGDLVDRLYFDSEGVLHKHQNSLDQNGKVKCCLCDQCIDVQLDVESYLTCRKSDCQMFAHVVCLGKSFTQDGSDIIPLNGSCPVCQTDQWWGDLIKGLNVRVWYRNTILQPQDISQAGTSSSLIEELDNLDIEEEQQDVLFQDEQDLCFDEHENQFNAVESPSKKQRTDVVILYD